MMIDQFDVLYEEGGRSARVMAVALHPFLVNQPYRHKHLARALEYITTQRDVWLTTADDIAEWYYVNEYDGAVSALKQLGRFDTTKTGPALTRPELEPT
jgi:hypothetical protein